MRRSIAFAAVLLLATTSTAFAQRTRAVAPVPETVAPALLAPGMDLSPCLFFLNLSEAQRLQIKQIMDGEQANIRAIADRTKTDLTALQTLADGANPDACAVGAAYMRVEADKDALSTVFRSIRTRMETVLTPDQRSKLEGCAAMLTSIGQMRP